jgi:predicted naringenin-chalcone synthase
MTPMSISILGLGTAVPPHTLTQPEIAERYCKLLGLEGELATKLRKIFTHSLIEKRHAVLPDFLGPGCELFDSTYPTTVPGTLKRNQIYRQEAPKLAQAAAEKALTDWGGKRKAITHIVSVSCTGMMAPGLEFLLVDALGLDRRIDRLGVNFMGCFGAFKGLLVARALAAENPNNRVLVVCTELCSIHFQADTAIDTLVSNSLFSDGAAAVVVGADTGIWQIAQFTSLALNDSLDHMKWEASDVGYVMRLSIDVPLQVRNHLLEFLAPLIDKPYDSYTWAVHPGGKAILHAVTQKCGLSKDHLHASWEVLRNFGNMSSPTFLFVLDAIRRSDMADETIGMGFGPGLSLEGVLLKR